MAIYAVLSHYRFLQFTRYYVEKQLAKNSARGEKMTNMRYVSDLQIVSTNAALSKKSLQLLVLQKAEEEKHLSELERARFCLS